MNRFNEALQELQPELALKKTKYDPAAWDKNFIELKELRENCQTYRIYALRTLGQAAVTAAERLRSADGTRSDVGTQYEQNDNIDVGIEQVVNVDEDTVYDDLDDVQKLMKFFICYVNGELMNDAQGTFLRKMMEQRVSIQDRLLASAAESLLNEDGWTNQMEINIKLCLSSIVSLISPESIAFTKTILTSSQMTSLIELSVSETFGFSDECIRVFDQLISERTIFEPDSIIENIYKLQAKYCWHKNSDLYRMLCILQQVISQFDDWSEQTDESENTVFRRFAVLLDILFRYTKIKMRDGECVAQITKDEIIVLQTIAGFVSSSNEAPYGKKHSNQCYNLVKTPADGLLRIDYCHGLERGTSGYAYTLSFTNGVFLTKKHTELMIPKRITQLQSFKETLKFMFIWKNHLLNMVASVDQKPNKDALRGIVNFTDAGTNTSNIPPVMVATPKSQLNIADKAGAADAIVVKDALYMRMSDRIFGIAELPSDVASKLNIEKVDHEAVAISNIAARKDPLLPQKHSTQLMYPDGSTSKEKDDLYTFIASQLGTSML
ncbi:hypothetical protein BDB00DRAFT_872739 [Zychaea mexicana]|uniref:uncharacterized protein n=1 Tax=Zychaea mexicana TaxID=64656 RepID=UPI0022FE0818|nr:uncharacterized protein BDB00DRAFT_872739 [Zychaea mexicana]KAI9493021.1 hypothetical protein BDB00DRAFT_872739 [Zychaea mexicana]